MDSSEIHHSLDLVVRLIDTTTGRETDERNVKFFLNDLLVRPIPRGSGTYVFINSGRDDGDLKVNAYGFEPCAVTLHYEEMDETLPMKEVFLIPSENRAGGEDVITLHGTLPGLTDIQAVSLGGGGLFVKEFDEKKCIMRLFTTRRMGVDDVFYGLVHPEQQTYEPFEVLKELEDGSLQLKRPLAEPFTTDASIARIVFGNVSPEGEYLLRVRDNSDKLAYLIRYEVSGKTRFKLVDFHHVDEVTLA